jgi:MerR family transcriptional regulator, redox-sensitive transcriptional activator SoxR
MSPETLTIGEVARTVDLNASAIRYYERIGVMPPATRVSGQRRYGLDTVQRLQLLKAAKRLGFTLEETQLLLAAEAEGEPADQMRTLAQRKLCQVDALIDQLMEIRRLLLGAARCQADHLCECAVLADSSAPVDPQRNAPHGRRSAGPA